MKQWMQDPMAIYAVSFAVFALLAYVYGRKPLLGWLDSEIAKIREELDAAKRLRMEAEATLADGKKQQAKAADEAKTLIDMARREADTLRQRAEADLNASLERQKNLAADRIKRAEAEAIADVRAAAVNAAMLIARKTLSQDMQPGDIAKLADQAISEMPALKAAKKTA